MVPVALGSLVLAALVVAPAVGRGWVLLLDWTAGPHPSASRGAWGLDIGPVYGPVPLLVLAIGRLVGHAATAWLFVAAIFPCAALGVAGLVGGSSSRRGAAALLYCVNPFVFERLAAGQVVFLLGYALFPFAVRSILDAHEARRPRSLVPAAWVAVLVAIGPHWAWLAGSVVGAVVGARFVQSHARMRTLAWGGAVALVALALSAHILVPQIGQPQPVEVGHGQLEAFATRGDARLGLFPNVAALYGFFRPSYALPRELGGWPFLFVGLAVVMALGVVRLRAGDTAWRRRALALAVAGAGAYLLALGAQGPTGPLYRWAVMHVPGFAVMREPQKFVAVLALFYAVLFAFGVEELVRRAGGGGRRGLVSALLAGALVVAYTPDLAWGVSSRLTARQYPDGWWQADRLMGPGPGKILFLPWHKFLAFPFADGNVIRNPASDFFRRDVIAGDDPELPDVGRVLPSPRSVFLESLFAQGGHTCAVGELLAPLGVEYVMLAKVVDWRRFGWLDDQRDLRLVLEDKDLAVYRNASYLGDGYAVGDARTAASVTEAARATCRESRPTALLLDDSSAVRRAEGAPDSTPVVAPVVSRRSPVQYEVRGAPPGWVVLPEPWDTRWRWDGRRPVRLLQGVVAFPVERADRGNVHFGGWNRVRLGYIMTVVTGAMVFVLLRFRRAPKRGAP